ncbi:Na+/H+ antiporter [Fulvimonas soli]|jgi:CPA1 family monovalent cation:H+ antiporter|uniref:Sodium/proton antiporter (CPA1 family) n=1 Tax=Fulvimonas soli TaxID=155197 RepID=A0A316HKU8_9GAMM|nr:Na+/H+ antiporter [Fulvimonas soli]PWK81855.1 sodium/proton antiporter (CPA1 family) [Fulvimonas soli]TNY27990.1 Na+/H+ antiporter [Fulvimonas soli]
MQSIEVVLAMLLALVGSSYLVRVLPFSLPLPLVQVGLGALIAALTGRSVRLDPEIFFLLFLPPLLFLDGWHIPKEGLLRDRRIVLQLAFGLVVFTVLGAGFLIHWMIPAMPLPVAFALAAIVSPTDPVAVSAIAARVPIPKRLMHILEGESLLNDASGLVCFRFAVAAALTGSFSLLSASLTFLWVALAGLAVGVGFTWGIALAQRGLSRRFGEESGSSILVNLLVPFGAYMLAEHLHASGILAAVAAGISMSYVELSGRALATTRVHRAVVWDTIQFALNGIVFVLLGEQLPGILQGAVGAMRESGRGSPWWLAAYALAINLALALLRLAWVWTTLRLSLFKSRLRGEPVERPPWRLVLATALAGVRGTITLAGVLTLPLTLADGTPFPARNLAVFLAMAVILVSLLGASLGLPRLLRGLRLPDEPAERREADTALREAAAAAIAAVEQAQHALSEKSPADADVYTNAAARVMANYQRRLDGGKPGNIAAEELRKADAAELTLRLTALQAEREEIFRLARRRRISDETARKLVREIDLLEERHT